MIESDILIVGGGIAGASAAFELTSCGSTTLLEREPQLGYHSTGRSAASFTENYGGAIIRRLAIASRNFLESPPAGFCEHPLLSPRGMVTIGRADQLPRLAEELDRARSFVPSIHAISVADAHQRIPVLRPGYVAGAFYEPDSRDIDVNGMHQGFIRGARARGARIVVNADVVGIERLGGRWVVSTSAGVYAAPVFVNAAGAWADVVATLAGVPNVGLVPKRRTAFNIPVPAGLDARSWPMVDDVGEEFYFKPDAGQLFVSPADTTPVAPMDAYPDDIDVATGVERLESATTIEVGQVTRSWAGLRSFVADGAPVVGLDRDAEGFFWLAAQGGYGIKTSPALSRACAELIRHGRLPDDLTQLGITAAELSPNRFSL